MTVRIIADSSCNVPESSQRDLPITVVPAWINFADGTSLRNGIDISDVEFYQRLTTEKNLPTTSQPTPQEFVEAILAEPADEYVMACVSSKLSGTYNSATQATSLLPEQRLFAYDTLSASVGSAWQIIAGAEVAARGGTAEAVMAEMDRVRSISTTLFVIDTLKYLAASGRAPAVQAMLGTLLNIKPMMQINDGLLEVIDRVRGRKRSKRELVERIATWADDRPVRVAIANANVPEEAVELAQSLKEQMDAHDLLVVELGPVLGALAGPGTLAIAAYPLE